MSDEETRDEAPGDDPTLRSCGPDAPTHGTLAGDGHDAATVLNAGRELGGYRLEEKLGSGGFAEVWRATRLDDGRTLALKLLRGVTNVDPKAVQRFEQEGRLAAALSHPRTVYVYSAEIVDGLPAITMELMPGGTLQDRVRVDGALGTVAAVDLVLDVLDGLEAAHRRGIMHRDIKPANCFLDEDGRARLGDFGISRSLQLDSQLTATGSFIGTPAYAAPEQIRGRPADERTDLYAVGALLYTLLAGSAPFASTSGGDLVAQVLTEKPPPFSAHGVRVPRALRRIVTRVLDKDPKRRPASCAELRAWIAPFSSRDLRPAKPVLRLAATALDLVITGALGFVALLCVAGFDFAQLAKLTGDARTSSTLTLLELLVTVLYFALFEGVRSQTPGKALMGLYVRRGCAPPSLAAAARALVFFGPVTLFDITGSALLGDNGGIVFLVGYLLATSTMRRSNGWRGLHEFVSGTRTVRVVGRPSATETTSRERGGDERSSSPEAPGVVRRGPYQVVRELWREGATALSVGRDPALERDVWILEGDVEESSHPTRVSRLRWLRRGDEPDAHWNAYEAPTGEPLLARIERVGPAEWDDVRRWLQQFAEEIATSLEREELPPRLSVERVWLDTDGNARLLPFSVKSPSRESAADDSWPEFLHRFAMTALGGTEALAVHASGLVEGLPGTPADHAGARSLVDELVASGDRPSTLDRHRRLRHLVYVYIFPWALGFVILLGIVLGESFRAKPLLALFNVALTPVIPVALVSVVSAFLFRGGPGLQLFGMTLRDVRGGPSGRLRSGLRAVVAWLPLLILTALMGLLAGGDAVKNLTEQNGDVNLLTVRSLMRIFGHVLADGSIRLGEVSGGSVAGIVLLLVFFAGVVAVVRRPGRGWQDRIAGTRLVPK